MPFPFCDLFLPSLKVSLLPFTWCLWLGSPRSSILSSLILVSSCTFQKLWELRHLWQHDQKNVYLFKILEGKTLKESVVVALLFLSMYSPRFSKAAFRVRGGGGRLMAMEATLGFKPYLILRKYNEHIHRDFTYIFSVIFIIITFSGLVMRPCLTNHIFHAYQKVGGYFFIFQ